MRGTDPILLVGPQRSGTTALAHAIAQAVATLGGCFTINGKLPYFLKRWCTDEDIEAAHLRSDEIGHGLLRAPVQGPGAQAWLERAADALRSSAGRCAVARVPAIEEVRRICADAYGSGPWGDKYNEYLLDLPWLHSAFPNARWIFLVREPSETIASMGNWPGKPWNPKDEAAASAKWAHWVRRWLDFRDEIAPGRRLETHYGALCAGRHDDLSDFIGTGLEPFLEGFRRSNPPAAPVALSEAAAEAGDRLRRIGALPPLDRA